MNYAEWEEWSYGEYQLLERTSKSTYLMQVMSYILHHVQLELALPGPVSESDAEKLWDSRLTSAQPSDPYLVSPVPLIPITWHISPEGISD